jgi:hypothetical protein
MSDTAGTERPVRGSRWSDDRSREALQSITEAICEVAGFDLVGVSAVRDDGYLQLLCVVGPEEAREALVDTLAPLEPLLEALENAEDWGRLKYVRHSRHRLDIDKWGWTSDGPRDVPDGVWHPEDILVAPLYGDDGRLIAVLGLDVPRDGLVPDESKRPLLDVYARQASGAVVATLERERMAERVRLAAAAADIVRRASASMSAERTLAECASAIVDGFRAQALWTQLVGEPPRAVHDAEPVMPPPETVRAGAVGRPGRRRVRTRPAAAPEHRRVRPRRDDVVPRDHAGRVAAARPARLRAGVPRLDRHEPRQERRRVERRRGRDGARHRP